LTSLLTFGVVSYISYVYLTVFCRIINNRWIVDGSKGISPAVFQGALFTLFPFLIFWSLLVLVFGDNGRVNQLMIQKIYRQNNIDVSEIGSTYTINDVRLLLTRNFLKQSKIYVSMDPLDQEHIDSSPEPLTNEENKIISEVEMNTIENDVTVETDQSLEA
jgi:hypothetical protein